MDLAVKQKMRNKKKLFWCKIAILFLMLLIRDVANIAIPNMIIIGYSCLLALTFDIEESYAYILILYVLAVGLQIYYILAFVVCNLLIRKYRYIKMNASFCLIIALFVWETLHAFYPGYSFAEWIRYVLILAVIGVTIFDVNIYEDLDGNFILVCFIVAVFFLTVDIALQYLKAYGSIGAILQKGIRFGDTSNLPRQASIYISMNPNQYGADVALALSAGLVLLFNTSKTKVQNIILILSLLILLLFGSMTQSRTYFLLVFFLILWVIVFYSKISFPKFVAAVLITLLLAGIGVLVLYLNFRELFDSIIGRFFVDDISNGRFDLYKLYFKMIFNEPIILFFGIGIQNIEINLNRYINLYAYFPTVFQLPHNAILESVLCWGWIGFVLLVLLFVLTAKNARGQLAGHTPKIINYLPLIMLAVFIQTGQFISSYDRFLLLLLAYCATITKNHKKENLNELF